MKTETAVMNWVKKVLWNYDVGGMKASSCHGEGEYFLSYNTPIARFVNGKIELATKKYSSTTSRHQGYLKRTIPGDLLVEVEEVKDEKGLYRYRW